MDCQRFLQITSRYSSLQLAVVGDICLDRYWEIDSGHEEFSLETVLPVHNVRRIRNQAGGAGTILNNLASAAASIVIHQLGTTGTAIIGQLKELVTGR
jgi:bifunctional ADP-heptose synthase (sugar kinase/adenylyltransferase)